MKKQKIYILMRNFHYHQKYPFGAPSRPPLAPTIFFHNLPLILPKRFHNHVDAARGRRQYHFETYFYYKTYERSKNRHFHVKLSLSSEISIWRAAAAPARTCNCFQNLPIIFSKQFHNHIGAHGPWQWRFAIYCGHKGYDIFIITRNTNLARCQRPHAPTIAFKTYPLYFQSGFILIQVRAETDSTILKLIFTTKVMKKLKIDIFMWNFHYHQKYGFGARCRRPRAPTTIFKTYSSYFSTSFFPLALPPPIGIPHREFLKSLYGTDSFRKKKKKTKIPIGIPYRELLFHYREFPIGTLVWLFLKLESL